jgi:hypothetical protein
VAGIRPEPFERLGVRLIEHPPLLVLFRNHLSASSFCLRLFLLPLLLFLNKVMRSTSMDCTGFHILNKKHAKELKPWLQFLVLVSHWRWVLICTNKELFHSKKQEPNVGGDPSHVSLPDSCSHGKPSTSSISHTGPFTCQFTCVKTWQFCQDAFTNIHTKPTCSMSLVVAIARADVYLQRNSGHR